MTTPTSEPAETDPATDGRTYNRVVFGTLIDSSALFLRRAIRVAIDGWRRNDGDAAAAVGDLGIAAEHLMKAALLVHDPSLLVDKRSTAGTVEWLRSDHAPIPSRVFTVSAGTALQRVKNVWLQVDQAAIRALSEARNEVVHLGSDDRSVRELVAHLNAFVGLAASMLPACGISLKAFLGIPHWDSLGPLVPDLRRFLATEMLERIRDGSDPARLGPFLPAPVQPTPTRWSFPIVVEQCARCDQPLELAGRRVPEEWLPEPGGDDVDECWLISNRSYMWVLDVVGYQCPRCGLVIDAPFELDLLGIPRRHDLRYLNDKEHQMHEDPTDDVELSGQILAAISAHDHAAIAERSRNTPQGKGAAES